MPEWIADNIDWVLVFLALAAAGLGAAWWNTRTCEIGSGTTYEWTYEGCCRRLARIEPTGEPGRVGQANADQRRPIDRRQPVLG